MPPGYSITVAVMACSTLAGAEDIRFRGALWAGESFRREIGHGLVFEIDPADRSWTNPVKGLGWGLRVGPATTADDFTREMQFGLKYVF